MRILNQLADLAVSTLFPNSGGIHSTDQGIPSSSIAVSKPPPDIGLVRGQREAKQALLIAAAGRHNILLVGPPGEGKSFLASTIPGFLPRASRSDSQALSRIYANTSIPLSQDASGSFLRPFRGIGPTITLTSLIGGGRTHTIPGEISLAHSGVLFIDELPQFSRPLIDALRQPLQSKTVSITRGGTSETYPCDFMFVAAMNPCPCGYYLSGQQLNALRGSGACVQKCDCSESAIETYQSKISGPILDRIDLVVEMGSLSSQERFTQAIPNQSLVFHAKIVEAWNVAMRLRGMLNCDLDAKETFDVSEHIHAVTKNTHTFPKLSGPLAWTETGLSTFNKLCDANGYSTRRAVRLARISRTIADLSRCYGIVPQHIQTAANYLTSSLLP